MGKNKTSLKKRAAYLFDEYMERGTRAQFGLLLVSFLVLLVLVGILSFILEENVSLGEGMWQTLMHLIDQGTIGGDELDNKRYLAIMLIVTFLGMVLTGTLIAIINSALSNKLASLKQGHSQIIEENHTVVIGFDDNIYCLLNELIAGNEHAQSKQCIVVIDEAKTKEEMDQLIADHVVRNGKNKLICRSGKLMQKSIYEQVSLERAKSIIINHDDDFQDLRILLAVTTYLREQGVFTPALTTLLHEEKSIESAEYVVADFPKARIIYFEDMLARIIAQVCRQPGLSLVLCEIFGYAGSEFYIETQDANGKEFPCEGMEFGQLIALFSNSIVVGIEREGVLALNPPPQTKLKATDKVVHLARYDKSAVLAKREVTAIKQEILQTPVVFNKKVMKFLVFGWNKFLPIIIKVLDQFIAPGSSVHIVADSPYDEKKAGKFPSLKNISVDFQEETELFSYATLQRLLDGDYTNILLLCAEEINKDAADAKAAMLLLHLRTVLNSAKNKEKYAKLIITSEMHTADDQKLLQVVNVNDFVVGSEITNRMVAQIANQPDLIALFAEILDAAGSEIYLRPAQTYVVAGAELTFAQMSSVVYNYTCADGTRPHEILLGYKGKNAKGEDVVELNPVDHDATLHKFATGEMLVVLSTGRDNPFMQ